MNDRSQKQRLLNWPLLPAVLTLAWPTMLEQLMSTAVQYVDTAMVGSLGTSATAAVGCTVTVNWLIGSTVSAMGVGFLAGISQARGALDTERARRVAAAQTQGADDQMDGGIEQHRDDAGVEKIEHGPEPGASAKAAEQEGHGQHDQGGGDQGQHGALRRKLEMRKGALKAGGLIVAQLISLLGHRAALLRIVWVVVNTNAHGFILYDIIA